MSEETEKVKKELTENLQKIGQITHISVDGNKKTAIVRFKDIQSAETTFKQSREVNRETGKRNLIIGSQHAEASILYIIPEISKEDEKI